MQVTTKEYLSLIPLGGLAIVYWVRDKFLFNRADGKWYHFSATQVRVLWMLYPLWIFLGWTLGMQTNRGQVFASFLTTTGQHIVGHYTVIGVLNDSFCMTRQQAISFALGLLISYIWTTFWLVISASEEDQVKHIVGDDGECRCDGH